MDSKTFPKGCNPGKGCFNCPYEDCINPDSFRLSEEEKAMLKCGWTIPRAIQRKREYKRAYYREHRQEILEYQQEYRQRHRQELLEYQQEYRQRHRQELLERKRAYYRQHRQELLAARQKRRQEILDE